MSFDKVLTPTQLKLTLTTANTEYSLSLPAGCKQFSMQVRSGVDARFSWITGVVAAPTESGSSNYSTLFKGGGYTAPEKLTIADGKTTIYFASGTDGTVIEVLAWSMG